ncbi:MAG: hypothetical protein HPY76_09600 [Anaerolineae bacterium]|jgi:hypothetical protein|nr:hypothetical protein [Anaerolineae bacterium]
MDDKITIIEGPPPTFQEINDGWALGINESPLLYDIAVTHLRTFNGPALVERCHRAWSHRDNIYLHYRNDIGLEESAPIMAARALETDDGNLLVLWVRLPFQDDDAEDEEFDLDEGESNA